MIPPDSPRSQLVDAEIPKEVKREDAPSVEEVVTRRERRKAILRLRVRIWINIVVEKLISSASGLRNNNRIYNVVSLSWRKPLAHPNESKRRSNLILSGQRIR